MQPYLKKNPEKQTDDLLRMGLVTKLKTSVYVSNTFKNESFSLLSSAAVYTQRGEYDAYHEWGGGGVRIGLLIDE